MRKGKALKPTWFNRLVVAPLILTGWVVFYPVLLFVGVIFWFIREVVPELIELFLVDWSEYTTTIKDGIRFITGRIKNK